MNRTLALSAKIQLSVIESLPLKSAAAVRERRPVRGRFEPSSRHGRQHRGTTAHREGHPMLTPTPLEELLDLAADVIGCDRRTLPAGAAGSPFITLGGSLAQ